MAPEIAPVATRRDWDAFLKLPWRIYRGNPHWVPPLLAERRQLFDRSVHPFHQHAEVEHFLAREGGRPVGRIAAIVNHNHLALRRDGVGFFGFFECIEAFAVARALLDTAAQWLRQRGLAVMRGPMNYSLNEECALLVEGYDRPPVFMMTYNPPYYPEFMERYGLAKAKDLLAYATHIDVPLPERLRRVADHLRARGELTVRPADLRRFAEELKLVRQLYNEVWQDNWGFVPLTAAELDFLAHQLRPLLVSDLVLFVESHHRPVGLGLCLPDYNVVLRRLNGRLGPLGYLKALWYSKGIKRLRLVVLGVTKEYQSRGAAALLLGELAQRARALGYQEVEISWILEDNLAANRLLASFGIQSYKRYRIYETSLA